MKNKKRRPLTLWDRQIIYSMRAQGCGVREIGRYLNRDASVVSRELRRNNPPSGARVQLIDRAEWADRQASRRLKARKRGKRYAVQPVKIREHIVDCLIAKKSPEAISATMEAEVGHKVSYSTIYRWIKRDVPELKKYLYEKGKKRRSRVMDRRGRFQQAAAAKRSIDERPIEADKRSEIGHLEGDTIHGRKGTTAAVLSIRDRKLRQHWFEKVANLEADTVCRAIIRLLHLIPPAFRKTLTLDRGSEFADWPMIEKVFPEFKVYFCNSYCPYQKGTNERGNRDLRKHHPKGSNFDLISPEEVKETQRKVNAHPMKLHQWRTPAAVAADCGMAVTA